MVKAYWEHSEEMRRAVAVVGRWRLYVLYNENNIGYSLLLTAGLLSDNMGQCFKKRFEETSVGKK